MTTPVAPTQEVINALLAAINRAGGLENVDPQFLTNLGLTRSQAASLLQQHQQGSGPGFIGGTLGGTLGGLATIWNAPGGIARGIAGALTGTPVPIAGTPTKAPPVPPSDNVLGTLGDVYGSVGSKIAGAAKKVYNQVVPQQSYTSPNARTAALRAAITGARGISRATGRPISEVIQNSIRDIFTPMRNVEGTFGDGGGYQVPTNGDGSSVDPGYGGGYPEFSPIPPPPPEFQFRMNDFSGQAAKMTAQAYSPQYQAIQEAKANVDRNYDRASKIVSGLYDNLTKDIAANTTGLNNQYQQAQAANTQRVADTQANIGAGYDSSQKQIADLVAKLGGGAALGQELLQPGAGDQAYAKSQAALSGQAQGQALQTQGQAAKDYQTAQGQAQKTQGVVAQQGLLNDRSNAQSSWDQQRLNLAGNEAQNALSLAQQLTGQDLNLQQLNYGAQQDLYNNQLKGVQLTNEQAQQMYQNRVNQQQANTQSSIAQLQLQLQARQMAHDMQLDYDKLSLQQQQMLVDTAARQRQLEIDQQNADTNMAGVTGQLKAAQQKANIPPDPTDAGSIFDNTLRQQIAGGDRDKAKVLKSLVLMAVNTLGNKGMAAAANGQDFADYVVQQAIQQNANNPGSQLSLDDVRNAAYAYYQQVWSKVTAPKP